MFTKPMKPENINPGESQTKLFKTKMCAVFPMGKCTNGSKCHFAHTESELRYPPDLRKTSLCISFMKQGVCHNKECSFAHGYHELRNTNEVFKTALCTFWENGNCKYGDHCRHAHGDKELRTRRANKAANKQRKLQAKSKDELICSIDTTTSTANSWVGQENESPRWPHIDSQGMAGPSYSGSMVPSEVVGSGSEWSYTEEQLEDCNRYMMMNQQYAMPPDMMYPETAEYMMPYNSVFPDTMSSEMYSFQCPYPEMGTDPSMQVMIKNTMDVLTKAMPQQYED